MKKTIAMLLALSAILSGCGDPYKELTTPINCACSGEWKTPINNKALV